MLGGSRRTALKLHDRADELLRHIAAPSAPVSDAVTELIDSMGDYDEDAGEVITEAAKQVLVFTFMRGYTLRLASEQPIEVPLPDEDPTACVLELMAPAVDDTWFYAHAFPQGPKVWEKLTQAFAPVANSMLLEDQPDGPIFPTEVIDQMLRAGYMGAQVDEGFQLRPVYRDEEEVELDPTIDSAFAKDLLAVRNDWEARVTHHEDIEEPNRLAILSASAGATVALGGLGAAFIDQFSDATPTLTKPDGSEKPDRIVQFAQALTEAQAVEAAYRVATWGMISELGAFFWRPNYELEMDECAKAFEFRNVYESEVPSLGEPVPKGATAEAPVVRMYGLMKGTLVRMIGAAIDEPIDPDDLFIGMQLPNWIDQFHEGLSVANERLNQLAPEGLPIWEG
jgi:hypothetical protein